MTSPAAAAAILSIAPVALERVQADRVDIFYRQAGPADGPVILLLHGFPASSHMFRELMPRLATRCHVIAPDFPGFGFTRVPAEHTISTPSTRWRRPSVRSPTLSE
jgi:pimeloyl-ACP methyl ester carboxylesterase